MRTTQKHIGRQHYSTSHTARVHLPHPHPHALVRILPRITAPVCNPLSGIQSPPPIPAHAPGFPLQPYRTLQTHCLCTACFVTLLLQQEAFTVATAAGLA